MEPTEEQIKEIMEKCHIGKFLPATMAIITEHIIKEWEKIRS